MTTNVFKSPLIKYISYFLFIVSIEFTVSIHCNRHRITLVYVIYPLCFSLNRQSVDTQKTAIRQSVTSDYLKPNTCNTKIVSSVNPGQIEKISDCDIKDKLWCTLGPSCDPRAGVLLPTDNPSIHPLTVFVCCGLHYVILVYFPSVVFSFRCIC
jgi:hypothetical protein